MEKVKISVTQEKALKEFKREYSHHDALQTFIDDDPHYLDFTPEQFAVLLCGWYEVEPEFKVGDWVVNDSTGVIKFIEDEKVSNFLTKEYINRHNIRHATPSEIAAEKERRWWSKLGREVNEYYVGDIIFYSQTRRYHRITGKYDGYITNEFGDRCEVDKLKLVCPAEKRLDVKTNE